MYWTNRRYFISDGRNRWTFGFKYTEDGKEKTYSLLRLADIPFVRYVKVKADANPFDPVWDEYFAKRAECFVVPKLANSSWKRKEEECGKKSSG